MDAMCIIYLKSSGKVQQFIFTKLVSKVIFKYRLKLTPPWRTYLLIAFHQVQALSTSEDALCLSAASHETTY